MRFVLRPAVLPLAGLIAAVTALSLWNLSVPGAVQDGLPDSFVAAWRQHSLVPRVWVALLAGAALGLSALIFQQVLRNSLAEPGTLGVLSGAQLAIALTSLGTVAHTALLQEVAGLVGGLLALAVVVMLAGARASGPVLLVAGLVVNLVIGSVFVVLALFRHEYLRSVFVWASGNLAQNDAGDATALALRLAVLGPVLLLLLRALVLFTLSDEGIRGLGANATRLRLVALVLATLLAAMVTARIGVIGFIGLAAPLIAQGLGIRTLRGRALAAPALGALLLLAADGIAQALARLLEGQAAMVFPTGILTPVLGGAILLGLLWRRRIADRPVQPLAAPARRPALAALLAVAVLIAVTALSLTETLHLPTLAASDLWQGRWPRVLTAASAGLMLALAGVAMQAITGNPLASPESLGISSGAGLGIIAGLFFGGAAAMLSGAVVGALVAFAVVVIVAARNRFAPGPLLLAGVALGTFAGAMISLMIASGDPRSFIVLAWTMGPTYRAEPFGALTGAATALIGALLFPLALRWLRILPLGTAQARALGVRPGAARFVLMIYVAALTGVATLAVGPVSFAGLMAPHLARALGAAGPGMQGLCAGALGAAILVLADLAGRTLWFPYEIPAGVLASLLGAPLFLWLIGKAR